MRRVGVPAAIVLSCLGLLAFGMIRLSAIEKTMRINEAANMLWVISQTEIEVLRLDATIARSDGGGSGDVSTRFDLLASRLLLLTEGPQLRYLERIGVDQPILEVSAKISAMDPQGTPLPTKVVNTLVGELDVLRSVLHRAANLSMVTEWEDMSARLKSYRGAVLQVILSLAFGIALAAILGWRLVADQRALLRVEEDRLRAVRLEQDLEKERIQGAYWRDFAAIVSHQFRTPLAIIDSGAQRIMRGKDTLLSPPHRERLETIRNTVADLSRLVEATLLAGQLENGIKKSQCAYADIAAPLQHLVSDLLARHQGREIALETTSARLRAWCDPGLTSHAVMNLLENALRHSAGPIVLRLFETGDRVACAVVDAGPGISPEEMTHIFDRFRRGSGKDATGSGLGLWTARKLAELQGGTLEVESWPRKGSVFTLWLRAQAPSGGMT